MNVRAREAQRKRKKRRGESWERGIVCQCLCQGWNMWLRIKHEAYCLYCGFQFRWQNKQTERLLVRKSVFACVNLSWDRVCVYMELQYCNPYMCRHTHPWVLHVNRSKEHNQTIYFLPIKLNLWPFPPTHSSIWWLIYSKRCESQIS